MDKLFLFISTDNDPCSFNQELEKAFSLLKINAGKKDETLILKGVGLSHTNSCSEALSVDFNYEENFVSSFTPYQNEEARDIEQDFTKISEKVHEVLDGEMIPGRTQVFAFWVANSIPDPDHVLEFYGVLERLQIWCNGKVEIITQLSDDCKIWKELLHLCVHESCTEAVADALNTLWIGSFEDHIDGEPCSSLGPTVCIENSSKIFTAFSAPIHGCTKTFVQSSAEVYGEVQISSVPWLSIAQEGNCRLTLLTKDSMAAHPVYENIITKSDVGILLRIRFSMQPLILKSPASLCSKAWKQSICDGPPLAAPTFAFKGANHTQVFLLIAEGSSDKHITAISLQDLNNYSAELVDSFLQPVMPIAQEDATMTLSLKLLKETSLYSPLFMRALSYLVDKVPGMFAKQVSAKGHNVHDYKPDTKEQIECLFSSAYFKHLFMSKQKPPEILPSPKGVTESLPEIEKLPAYQALVNYEKMKQRNASPSKLFLPSFNKMPLVPVTASEISKCFQRNGEPSESQRKKMTKIELRRRRRQFDTKEESLAKDWPECLDAAYHGIHYHLGNGNEVSEGFIMSHEQHVQNETDSACSVFTKSDTFVTGASDKRNKSKSKASTSKVCVTPSKTKVARQIQFDSPSRNLRSSKDPLKSWSPGRPYPRRSPRKKVQVNNYVAQKTLPSKTHFSPRRSKRDSQSEQSELSALHTQKLRNAVMNALESENILIKNPIFKNCFKKLFAVCKPFAIDIIGMGSTSRNMLKIAMSHVTQVIEFEKLKSRR